MAGNYDNSAGFYDGLSRLVFGKALVNAQIEFLNCIPANSNILIVGGGTGWILDEITRIYPAGLIITYVEISAKMTALSRKRNVGKNSVEFIIKPVEQFTADAKFDVVITPFLFDNYKEENLPGVFNHIHQMLKPGGLWLNTDFQLTGKWWQYVLLKTMLLFFKILCGVESWRLPDVASQFNNLNYKRLDQKLFFKDFIVTGLYRK